MLQYSFITSWDKKEWDVLLEDIVELCEPENSRTHFIGSIVSMPTVSVPEGVAKYLLRNCFKTHAEAERLGF